jgi:hypothetical protein
MITTHRHLIVAALAAALAGAGGGAVISHKAVPAPKVTERVVQQHVIAHKYDWGSLSDEEQSVAAQAIGNLDRREVEVFCGVPACQDLAEDIDQIMDMTHAASTVRRPMIELGAGIGIMPADDDTRRIAQAIRDATGGRIDLQVIDQKYPGGGIAIVLGQIPRAASTK